MGPYIPQVNDKDVRRIIARDFVPELHGDVRTLLASSRSSHWGGMESRIFLAILKMAQGSVDEVKRQASVARADFRDVVGAAEYPRFTRIGFVGAQKLTADESEKLQYEDYSDYLEWLNKGTV